MKDKNVCPGCGKHCPLSKPSCSFGRKYSARHAPAPIDTVEENKKNDAAKWECGLKRGTLAWRFLHAAHKAKKELRGGEKDGDSLFGALTLEEKISLSAILEHIGS